jgi:hypothetical protein
MHGVTVKMNVSGFTLVLNLMLCTDELTEGCVPQLVSIFQILLGAMGCKNVFLLCLCARTCVLMCVRVCVLYNYSPVLDYSIPRPKGHRYIHRQFFVMVNRRPLAQFSYSLCAIEFNGTGDRPFLGTFAKL